MNITTVTYRIIYQDIFIGYLSSDYLSTIMILSDLLSDQSAQPGRLYFHEQVIHLAEGYRTIRPVDGGSYEKEAPYPKKIARKGFSVVYCSIRCT